MMHKKGLYNIPAEKDVLRIAIEILEDYGLVNSLSAFTRLVRMRARSENEAWRIGAARLKRIVACSKSIRMEIITRDTDEDVKKPVCMVCGGRMEPEMNRTLDGDVVVLGYVCTRCGYRTGTKRKIPVRYVFRMA